LIQQPAERVSYRAKVVRAVGCKEPMGDQGGNLAVPDFDWHDAFVAFMASAREAHPVGGRAASNALRVTVARYGLRHERTSLIEETVALR
jgi:hypothetical protein